MILALFGYLKQTICLNVMTSSPTSSHPAPIIDSFKYPVPNTTQKIYLHELQ